MNNIKLAPLLLIFAEVAKQKSFTGAAKTLGLSKSAVSQQIKRLESELSMQLLARNTRGVVLTQLGHSLLTRSELLSQQLANVVTDIQQVKAQPSGKFKVSAPPFLETNLIVPALKQVCSEFPLIEPELDITGKWQDLMEHELDVAIFGGDLRDSNYKAQSIGRVSDLFCASNRYVQQHGSPHSLEDLTRHKYIASGWQHNKVALIHSANNQPIECQLHSAVKTNNLNTLVEMACADMGIALLPEFIAIPKINQNTLVHLLPEYKGRTWHFYLLHRYQDNKPAHVARFYEWVKYYFKAAMVPQNKRPRA